MLAVLCGGSLRRAEVVSLDLANYDSETGALPVRCKGRKERALYATHEPHEARAAWLPACGETPGPLFVRIGKGKHMTLERLTDQAIWHVLQQRR